MIQIDRLSNASIFFLHSILYGRLCMSSFADCGGFFLSLYDVSRHCVLHESPESLRFHSHLREFLDEEKIGKEKRLEQLHAAQCEGNRKVMQQPSLTIKASIPECTCWQTDRQTDTCV